MKFPLWDNLWDAVVRNMGASITPFEVGVSVRANVQHNTLTYLSRYTEKYKF